MSTKSDFNANQHPIKAKSGVLAFLRNATKALFAFVVVGVAYASDVNVGQIAQEAKKHNKHIMFFHHIPKCSYCEAMIEENFKDEALMKELNEHFIYVDVYTKTKGEIRYKNFKGTYREFSAHVGAFAYPSIIFMNDEGEIVHKAIGYRNTDEHFAEMKYISTSSYKTMDLDAYKVKLEFEKD